MTEDENARLIGLDRDHVWHPFTPMRQWRDAEPLVIERAEGEYLIDARGKRYIDGVSSLWCNVHGHRVEAIDSAIRAQLDMVAHTTLLGLASPPSIELAAELTRRAPAGLNKVFYSDAGATAVEVALKMAVGYWFHRGRPEKRKFVAFRGGYHGDTTGAMSVGYSELFHRPFGGMTFPVTWVDSPNNTEGETPEEGKWPSECLSSHFIHCRLEAILHEGRDEIAAVILEPEMQGAAGMMCQPPDFVPTVRQLCRETDVLLIADEVATGFGRTGAMFACHHSGTRPDLLCLGKGITGGYLPLAATLATDEIDAAFTGELADRRTFFHGHTYTGNALACAAALASLELFDSTDLLARINQSAALIAERLNVLRNEARFPHVVDVRQRGLMIGIELGKDRATREPFDFAKRTGAAVCAAMREKGLILRPLGDVIVLMPILASQPETLHRMMDVVIETIGGQWPEIGDR